MFHETSKTDYGLNEYLNPTFFLLHNSYDFFKIHVASTVRPLGPLKGDTFGNGADEGRTTKKYLNSIKIFILGVGIFKTFRKCLIKVERLSKPAGNK